MNENELEKLKQELDELGSLNIEVNGELTVLLIRDVIDAVKSIDLDFDKLLDENKKLLEAHRKKIKKRKQVKVFDLYGYHVQGNHCEK